MYGGDQLRHPVRALCPTILPFSEPDHAVYHYYKSKIKRVLLVCRSTAATSCGTWSAPCAPPSLVTSSSRRGCCWRWRAACASTPTAPPPCRCAATSTYCWWGIRGWGRASCCRSAAEAGLLQCRVAYCQYWCYFAMYVCDNTAVMLCCLLPVPAALCSCACTMQRRCRAQRNLRAAGG